MAEGKYDYDLVVIGGGSGGLACAKEAGSLGKKVACLDFVTPSPAGTTWGLGGTCVNVGCIPKKLYHTAAIHGENLHDAKSFGWQLQDKTEFSWEAFVQEVIGHIKGLNFGYRTALRQKDVKYINAFGTFIDAHTIECTDKKGKKTQITTENVVIAVGGRPKYLDIPGSKEFSISSDDIFFQKKAPGKTLCVGASYVSLECAGFLTGLGYDTTVMIRSIPLRGFDQQMAGRIVEYMENHGTKFIKKAVPTKIEKNAEGRLEVTFTGPDGESKDVFDTVIQAVGRDPVTSGLCLDKAGVTVKENGRIPVKNEVTNVPNIYALGDCVEIEGFGFLELTPVAIQSGVLVAKRMFTGAPAPVDYRYVPTTVFTPLEYGAIGMAEEDAITKHGEDSIEVYHSEYTPLEWTIPHREEGACYMKVICNKKDNERILGMHVLGPNAGEQIQGFTLGIKLGATFDDLTNMIGIHPTCAESFTTLRITKASGESAAATGC